MINYDAETNKYRIGKGPAIYDTEAAALAAVGASVKRRGPHINQVAPRRPIDPGDLRMAEKKCRSCKAAIIWTLSAANTRRLPVDAIPTPRGNLQLHLDHQGDIISTVVKNKMGALLHMAHFATCPNAARHRKKTSKGGRK